MKPMQISLRAGQRVFLNGAVIRADRKVTLDLMNDAVFLLDSHVIQEEETTTPLRQLYFVAQAMLIDPKEAHTNLLIFREMFAALQKSFANATINEGLASVATMVEGDRTFEALRALRNLFPVEAAILRDGRDPAQAA